MPATTADGWPYALPSDARVDWPATSQSIANLLESRWDTYQAAGVLTPSSGWVVMSGQAATYTRASGIVVVQGVLGPTSTVALGQNPVNLASLPAGARPVSTVYGTGHVSTGSAPAPPCAVEVTVGGTIRAFTASAASLAANTGCILFNLSFRSA